jgi:hypothetical protein
MALTESFSAALAAEIEFIYDEQLIDLSEHTAPLRIRAKGSTLIVGPDPNLAELALIENDIASGAVTEIVMVDAESPLLSINYRSETLKVFREIYPNIPVQLFLGTYSFFLAL